MNAQNDNLQDLSAEDRDIVEWVRKHFAFLIEDHHFVYAGQAYGHHIFFDSTKMRIEFRVGRKSPSVLVYKVGEPDFTCLVFERIMQYFGDEFPEIYFPDHPIEHNIQFMAKILKGYAPKIMETIDDWWLPVHLFQYKLLENEYKKGNQHEDFLVGFKPQYDYLKSKGTI
jgi:hypothetical protein